MKSQIIALFLFLSFSPLSRADLTLGTLPASQEIKVQQEVDPNFYTSFEQQDDGSFAILINASYMKQHSPMLTTARFTVSNGQIVRDGEQLYFVDGLQKILVGQHNCANFFGLCLVYPDWIAANDQIISTSIALKDVNVFGRIYTVSATLNLPAQAQ